MKAIAALEKREALLREVLTRCQEALRKVQQGEFSYPELDAIAWQEVRDALDYTAKERTITMPNLPGSQPEDQTSDTPPPLGGPSTTPLPGTGPPGPPPDAPLNTLPVPGPDPVLPKSWNDPVRVMRMVLNYLEEKGPEGANQIVRFINSKLKRT